MEDKVLFLYRDNITNDKKFNDYHQSRIISVWTEKNVNTRIPDGYILVAVPVSKVRIFEQDTRRVGKVMLMGPRWFSAYDKTLYHSEYPLFRKRETYLES